MRQLYQIDMSSDSSLIDHERTFDDFVKDLSAMNKNIKKEDLVIIYANSLSMKYKNQLQGQVAILTNDVTLSEFKSRVREEVQRLKNFDSFDTTADVEMTKTNVASNLNKKKKKNKKFGKC